MRKRSSWIVGLGLVALAGGAAPGAARADAEVGGRGPRIVAADGRTLARFDRPVFVEVDELAQFGHLAHIEAAPPLVIRVEGDVEITRLPDGSLQLVLDGED